MPLSNKRNSRDDKSRKKGRPATPSAPSGYKSRGQDTQANNRNQPGRKSGPYKGRSGESGRPYSDGPRKTWENDEPSNRSDRKPAPYKGRSSGPGRPYSRDSRNTHENDSTQHRAYREKRTDSRHGSDATKPVYERRRGTSRKPFQREPENNGLVRLNRYIANAGICSRRKADELIEAGVIRVNGEVVTALGTKVDPAKDDIRYNGERLQREKMVYVLLNKPKDYITTTDDPQERRTVMQLVAKATRERIYPVGRLDRNTTGLLLLTNDGNLSEKLSHPRNNVSKIYQVELHKNLTQGDLNKIAFGVELEDGFVKPDAISYVQGGSKREIGVQIHSGKNRIVRRIFESLGYDVVKLDRVVYANLTKKDLPRGRWRFLEEKEIIQLKHFIK